MPKKIKPVKPEFDPTLLTFLEAFYDLSSCRQIGTGAVGPIPYTAILKWVDYWDVDCPDFYITIVQSLDQIYLAIINKKEGNG